MKKNKLFGIIIIGDSMNINVSDAFITYGISLVSLVFTLLVLILFIAKGKSHKYSSIVFRWLLVITIIVALFNIISALFKVNNHHLTHLSCCATIFFTICWNFLLLFYIILVFKDDDKNKEFFSKHTFICFIIGIILLLVNLLACIFLKIDFTRAGEGLPYLMSGSLQTFDDITGGIAVVVAVVYITINRKKLDRLAILLCIYTVAFCVFTLIGTVAGFLSLNNTSFQHALVLFFLFLSLESQDALLVAEFRESTRKANEYNKLRSDFIMNMSHELRTPLTAVLGFSDSLISSDFSLDELKEDSKNIYISSKNLLDLINSIVDVSKLDGNKEVVNINDYSLDSVLYDISSIINSYITKENLIFTIDADENCVNDLNGDDKKINKIIKILLMTAINHTDYGEVSLNVYSNAIDSSNHEIVFHIKNSGHTLSISDFERSLDDLIKVSADNDNVIDSGSLNLIIAKGLTDLIGGSIEFINETGKGTQFIVRIKQKVTSQNKLGNIREKIQTKYVLSHQILSLSDKKVLIVDTQKVNIDIIERMLKQYSFGIDTSLSLNDGIALFNAYSYDLIFVNNNLGDQTGLDFVTKLNSTGNKVPPIIGIVSKSDNYKGEYFDILEIPLEFRNLNNVINKVFAKGDDINEL